eukprot:4820525-Amphidinium_carterae.1
MRTQCSPDSENRNAKLFNGKRPMQRAVSSQDVIFPQGHTSNGSASRTRLATEFPWRIAIPFS